MKNFIYVFFAFAVIASFSCQEQNDELLQTPEQSFSFDDQSGETCSARSSCDNEMPHDGCNFTSGEHTYSTDLADEYETLLNNCHTEPLPSNCSWAAGPITTYVINYHPANWCCYDFNAHNFRVDQIMQAAQSTRPASNYLITGYEVSHYVLSQPNFKVKVTYRKRGMCSLPADKVHIR